MLRQSPPTLGTDAFLSCSKLTSIVVPSGYLSRYQEAEGWKSYIDILSGS
jgi:hypothetical protein